MKSVGDVLLLIGGIFSLIAAIGCLICGIVLITLGSPNLTEFISEAIESGAVETYFEDVAALQSFLILMGIIVSLVSIIPLLSAMFAFLAKSKKKAIYYILCIVFSALSVSYVSIVGCAIGYYNITKKEVESDLLGFMNNNTDRFHE